MKGKFCVGCFRTRDEIAKWSKLSHEEKKKLLEEIKIRQIRQIRQIKKD